MVKTVISNYFIVAFKKKMEYICTSHAICERYLQSISESQQRLVSNYVIIKHIQTFTLTLESPLAKYAIHSLILFINSVTLTCAMMELDILSINNMKEMNVSVGIFLYSLNKISTTYVCNF